VTCLSFVYHAWHNPDVTSAWRHNPNQKFKVTVKRKPEVYWDYVCQGKTWWLRQVTLVKKHPAQFINPQLPHGDGQLINSCCDIYCTGFLKDPLALTVMHCALFILIRPDMGRDLSRGKITASHLEEEMNTEFEMSVVSNFLVSTSSPVRHQKPVKHFCRLRFGPLNPPSCSSRRGHFLRLQKSHLKEK